MNGRKEILITQYNERPLLMYQIEDKIYDIVVGENHPEDVLEVGDIYVGRVQNIVQNINAAFVEVKKGVICYLPFNECINNKIRIGDEFVVQVKKAAVKTKQAVVTQRIELVGSYCVISTKDTEKSISRKITEQTIRDELQLLLETYEDRPYGIMLRTNAANVEKDVVWEECNQLLNELDDIMKHSVYKTCFSQIKKADPFYLPYLRHCQREDYDRILTDCKEVYEQLQNDGYDNLEFYEDSNYPLEKLAGIKTKLDKALSKRVWLKCGGNLVIEPTEALTVIDVNTGKAIEGKRNKETTFFKVNCEAAKEAARQIRLRNMSGIIVIDFIDMKKKEHQQELIQLLKNELQKDKTKTVLVDITKLGLIEVTRMKKSPPLWEFFS